MSATRVRGPILSAEQSAAAHAGPQGAFLIAAGPGTGKTFTATERFCWLVEQGVPSRVLTTSVGTMSPATVTVTLGRPPHDAAMIASRIAANGPCDRIMFPDEGNPSRRTRTFASRRQRVIQAGSMSLPFFDKFGSVHAARLKQQGRRFPLFIFEILTLTRLLRVSGSWVALTQRTHSQRAIGVIAFHRPWIF